MTTSTVFVLTMNGGKGKWSRYTFPFAIDAFAQLGNILYIRTGDYVVKVSEDVATDSVAGVATNFAGVAQWAWLDFGQPGVTKMVHGFDYVGEGQAPTLSVGFDQRDTTRFTAPYQLSNDTLTGTPVPFPIAAPTVSVKLAFAGGAAWTVNAVNVYLDDLGGQP